jgi:hypothetical protein
MKAWRTFAVLGLALGLASCAHQPSPIIPAAPGFLMGMFHGVISPIALVAGIFTDVRMYAFPNSGGWYDFGFLLGLGAWGGGTTAAVRS